MSASKRIRLDKLLVDLGHYQTRSRARDAIMRKCIRVDGTITDKPGTSFHSEVEIEIQDEARQYVSRAALKLKHALSKSGFSPKSRVCLDIGASTGGFTQILLEHGAKFVYGIDVGTDQMDPIIREDERVKEISNLNARDLTIDMLDHNRPEFLVCDVSFISLKLALPPALNLAADSAKAIFLIKPQFEVGKSLIGKGGLVSDPEAGKQAAMDICTWLGDQPHWNITEFSPSPLTGGDGNQEYLVALEKTK